LRALHTTAALATAALLALGGPSGMGYGLTGPWVASLVLLGVAVAGAVLLDDPTGSSADRGGEWVRAVLGGWRRLVLLGAGVALLVATTALVPMPAGATPLVGSNDTLQSVSALLTVICGAVAVLLIPAARLARPSWLMLPPSLRPWAGGWYAAPVLALAVLTGVGFGAGFALTVRRLLGREDLQLPAGYTAVTLVWGAGGIVLAGGVLLTGVVLASANGG
jgi:hypothetical protein